MADVATHLSSLSINDNMSLSPDSGPEQTLRKVSIFK